MAKVMTLDMVDVVSRGLGSIDLSEDDKGNSRGSEIVLNAVPRELLMVDGSKEGNLERSFVRSVVKKDKEVIDPSSESSDDGNESGDDCTDDQSAGEPEKIDTKLDTRDAELFAELTKVLREEGDLKKLKVEHLKAYLRYHGLRMSGLKADLLRRIEDHLNLKDGQAVVKYPKSSFSKNCKGDVCCGDAVLFTQRVYDSFDVSSRSGNLVGQRLVAGKVVHESYGAVKQQHTFTIEVLWSTGAKPFYLMRPLLIKGRNLYRINTKRQLWKNETDREKVLEEKHARGEEARAQRRGGRNHARHAEDIASRAADHARRVEEHARRVEDHARAKAHAQRRVDSSVAHSHSRDHIAESNRIPPTIPPFQNSMQHGRARTEHQARAQTNQQYGRADTEYAGAHTERHGRTEGEEHVYRSSTGHVHMICSTHGCEQAGAKHCLSQSCAACCFRNASTRGKCPRHSTNSLNFRKMH